MRILVTGAAGFVASHLAERLARDGHDVVGLDNFSNYYAEALKRENAAAVAASGVEILEIDLASDNLTDTLAGVETVYHLAAQPGISASTPCENYLRNNFIASQRLLQAATEAQSLILFVNVSTSSVYGLHATSPETAPARPASYYGVTKLAAEALALSYHDNRLVPATSFRLFSVYGPRERPEKLFPRLIRSIVAGQPFPLYKGATEHSRSFTYIGDIVEALVRAAESVDACAGEVFNIGSDSEFKTLDAIRIVERLTGGRAQLEEAAARPGDQLRTSACIDKIRDRLGYRPRVSLEEGLALTVDWFRGHPLPSD